MLCDRACASFCGVVRTGKSWVKQKTELRLWRKKSLKPDVIILDVSMPGQDGLDVAGELRRRNSASKIVILTMHESRELASAVNAVGAQGYVIKSHAGRDLVKAIQAIDSGGQFFSLDPSPPKAPPHGEKKKPPLRRLSLVPVF